MSILLQALELSKTADVQEDDWVEIDLLSWSSFDSDFPYKLTLIRQLNARHEKPYLQNLMFKSLYENKGIKQLILQVPSLNNTSHAYVLNDVKVKTYTILTPNDDQKRPHEKIILLAKSKSESVIKH